MVAEVWVIAIACTALMAGGVVFAATVVVNVKSADVPKLPAASRLSATCNISGLSDFDDADGQPLRLSARSVRLRRVQVILESLVTADVSNVT